MTFRSFVIAFIIALALGYGGYYAYTKYQDIQIGIAADKARTQEIEVNHARLADALSKAGVSPLQVGRGFWYTYADAAGNESVAYFDIDQWSLTSGLSDQDLASLTQLIAGSSVSDRETMRSVQESELPEDLRFHNALYSSAVLQKPGAYQSTLAQLESLYQKGTASREQLWELSYMYELSGEYAKRDAVNAESCDRFKVRCAGDIRVVLQGKVVDLGGRPVQGASVTVLSHPEIPSVTTDAQGAYSIKLAVNAMEKLRVSAVKRNFTSGVASTIVLAAGKSIYALEPIVLASPILIVTLDTAKHTVTDPGDVANPDGSFVLHATSSTYEIPPGAIVHANGAPYAGPVDVYIYEFTRETVPESLMTIDTFNDVMGYAGNLMQTLGMPYIQFFSPSGEQLDVLRSKPMLLTYKIAGMQDMLTNYYKRPEGPLTEGQLKTILAASQGDPGFPITAAFLYKYDISTFPPFWVFDHVKGTWENQGMRLLDISGTMQAPFYTRDNQ